MNEGGDSSEISVVLTNAVGKEAALSDEVTLLINDTLETSSRLDILESKLGGFATPIPHEYDTNKQAARIRSLGRSRVTWDSVYADASAQLLQRGIKSEDVSINDLLDDDTVKRIDDRFSVDFDIRAHLDRYDIAMSIAAGLTAAAIDMIVVRVPLDMIYSGSAQRGSSLTAALRDIRLPGQTWLEQHCKTAFDHVALLDLPEPLAGFGGKTHRLLTVGHDPLLGLLFGTMDIMRGGLSAIDARGKLAYFANMKDAVGDPFAALAIEIGHLFSDAFTKMGLPAPGWVLTQTLQFGSFGEKDRTIADLARFMYLKGYDSRHFLTMGTSVVAAEIVLRGYSSWRRFLDKEYDDRLSYESNYAGRDAISHHPRYLAMATIAHLIACACNAGKIVIYQGNPLALNYAQWLRFIHAALSWQRSKMRQPSELLRGLVEAQLDYLESRWPASAYEVDDFPTLFVGER
jgi:hypothetical protein